MTVDTVVASVVAAEPANSSISSGFIFSSWTASTLKSAANLTSYVPSAKDLLLAGPRVGMKLGSYIFSIPEVLDGATGGRFAQRVIPQATALGAVDAATTAGMAARDAAQAGADMLVDAEVGSAGIASRLSVESARSFGNIFSYSTSRWALACIVMAIALNRTHIYASPRRNLTLGWKLRLVIRLTPILLFAYQARGLLQSIQCQTSPDFSMMRWGNASKSSELLFTQSGGVLHTVSSKLLFGASDESSCLAVNMVPLDDTIEEGPVELSGSLSKLWPLFQTLCFSQFVETLSCALQGRQVAAETGMTLFEHSLAFAEAEAAVSSTLGWGPFGEKRNLPVGSSGDEKIAELVITRSMVMKRVNTPPEVLLVGFLSSMNHLTSHVLSVFNLQGRLRLVSTAFWGLCFMSAITLSIVNFSIEDLTNQALLRFPTVCIIGFIPHVLVLSGILLCSGIYGLALILTALAQPNDSGIQPRTFRQKLLAAHENMQANVTLSNIRISMHMDFYQALLKTGYNALTIAAEAVYLNESSDVNIKHRTWLEEERLKELENTGAMWLGPSFRSSQQEMADEVGLVPVQNDQSKVETATSGFARERTASKNGRIRHTDRPRDGVGATERSGRWIMAFEFFLGIARLIMAWVAAIAVKLMGHFGIHRIPRWLNWLLRRPKLVTSIHSPSGESANSLDFWLLGDDGTLRLPRDNEDVDVEAEMRRRLKTERSRWDHNDEQRLDTSLYGWWLEGGWWGNQDNSGQFKPVSIDDEDNTSVISTASEVSDFVWESDEDEGRRTPTQLSPQDSRESTPMVDTPMSTTVLAQLLHPRTPEQRAEAQVLAAHFSSDSIVTRSKFRTMHQQERTRVLTSTRQRPVHLQSRSKSGRLSEADEVEILEHLITSRRASGQSRSSDADGDNSWSTGATGMGESGPQCVVCQSAPRSIIVWPCRCLSLCDDCRVTLAMNNFDKCVCCRRDVGSFSRIFVP